MSRLRRVADKAPVPLTRAARRALVRTRHVGLRSADVVLASYPKSGSTWLRFVLADALSDRTVDFDTIRSISPPVGRHRGGPELLPGGGRLVKSHELPLFVPGAPVPKVIHLARDGRDVLVSYFHHARRAGTAPDSFDAFVAEALRGDRADFGTWHDHALAWHRFVTAHPATAVTLRYEDLRRDPVGEVLQASDRLALGLTREVLERAFAANDTAAMRAKETSSSWLREHSVDRSVSFVRAGRTGDWRETFDDAALARFEATAGGALRALGYPAT